MSYTRGPYARFTSLPVPPRPAVHSARSIDFTTLRYEVDTVTGGFVRMPPIVQKVMLRIMFAVPEPRFNTEQERTAAEKAIRNALADMTAPPNPEILVKEISLEPDGAGSARRTVVFKDLVKGTGKDLLVQLT